MKLSILISEGAVPTPKRLLTAMCSDPCFVAISAMATALRIGLDFDHQFIAADKKDAKYSYKKSDGYFPDMASVGSLIVEVENR